MPRIMKPKTQFVLVTILLSSLTARAQWTVHDPAALAQSILNMYVAQDQLRVAENELLTTTKLLKQVGNPATIQHVVGAQGVLQAIQSTIPGTTLSEIQAGCTGVATLSNDGNGIYRPVNEMISAPDGSWISRQPERYKPSDAVDRTAAFCQAINNDTEARRATLLQQIKATTEQVQRAQTLAEIEKLQVVASAQNAALSSIEAERLTALTTVLVQEIQNRSDEKRQQQAQKENNAVDFHFASKQTANFLTPFSKAVTIPQKPAR